MAFTVRDLRYQIEQSYPALDAYLRKRAERELGPLRYDSVEVDQVVGYVIDNLIRLGLLGGEGNTPLTALDHLAPAQFYMFLNRSVKNKAIDRLRRRRLSVASIAEPEGPFRLPPPEELSRLRSQQDGPLALLTSKLLEHCIMILSDAPRQNSLLSVPRLLEVVIEELREIGAAELLRGLLEERGVHFSDAITPVPHLKQFQSRAQKKVTDKLQQSNAYLTNKIASRLRAYGEDSANTDGFFADIRTLAQNDLSEEDVQMGLKQLADDGLLDWHGEEVVHFTSAQMKRFAPTNLLYISPKSYSAVDDHRKLQVILQELEELNASALLQDVLKDFQDTLSTADLPLAHVSQHRDHAHRKPRYFFLKESSTNLVAKIAFRLIEYGVHSPGTDKIFVDIRTLAQNDLSEEDVQMGLKQLADDGLLDWHGEEVVHFTSAQMKRFVRFYDLD